jgi:hypothetical protein
MRGSLLHSNRLQLLLALISSAWYYSATSVLILYLTDALGLPAALAGAILLSSIVSARVIRFVGMPLLGGLPPNIVILCCHAAATLAYAGLIIVRSTLVVAFLLAIVELSYGTLIVTIRAILVNGRTTGLPGSVAYAAVQVALNIGGMISPVAANHLFINLDQRAPFILSACFAAAGVLVASAARAARSEALSAEALGSMVANLFRRPQYSSILLISLVFGTFYSALYTWIPLIIAQRFNKPGHLGYIYMTYAAFSIVASLPSNYVLAKVEIGPALAVGLSYCLYSAGFLMVAILDNHYSLFSCAVAWSIATGLFLPNLFGLIATEESSETRSSLFSINALALGVGQGLGSFLYAGAFSLFFHHLAIANACIAVLLLATAFLTTKSLERSFASSRGSSAGQRR